MYWVSSTASKGAADSLAAGVADSLAAGVADSLAAGATDSLATGATDWVAAGDAAGAGVPQPTSVLLTIRAIRVSRVNSLVHFDFDIGHPPCDFVIAYGFP